VITTVGVIAQRKMKALLFVMIVTFLAVSVVTAQQGATGAPKHYIAVDAEVPDTSVTPDGRFSLGEVANEGGDVHLFASDLTTGERRPLRSQAFVGQQAGAAVGWRREL